MNSQKSLEGFGEDESNLYFYCSAEAFYGIINSKTLWASDLKSMNDPREVGYGSQVVSQMVESLHFLPGTKEQEFCEAVQREFKSFQERVTFFGTCFSRVEDGLYQWLEYAERGTGFMISFRYDALDPSPLTESRILYSPEDVQQETKVAWEESLKDYVEGVMYRMKEGAIVPYISVPMVHKNGDDAMRIADAIEGVHIGPKNLSNVDVVMSFLRSLGFESFEVHNSDCDFR